MQFLSADNTEATEVTMHSIEEFGTNVPAFLAKLWKIVDDPETNDLISWSSSGSSFYIRDQARFSHDLLPLYYKHNNMASFIRQLNMYGFHKVVSLEGGGLRSDNDEMEFAHQCFLMDHPHLLTHIKRKVPVQKMEDNVVDGQPELIKRVLTDVKGLKGRQDNLNSQLINMKRENEVLWRELAVLRQKHNKQQQIVNKLIQFLISMVHNTHTRSAGIGIKRYMLSHFPHNETSSKMSKNNVDNLPTRNESSSGPIIHELDPTELLEECARDDNLSQEEFSKSNEFLSTVCQEPDQVEEVLSPNSSTGSMSSLEAAVNTASPDVLLELAEECSLQAVQQVDETLKNTLHLHSSGSTESHSRGGNRKKRLKKIEVENDNTAYLDSLREKSKDVTLPSFMKDSTADGWLASSRLEEEILGNSASSDTDNLPDSDPTVSGSHKKRKIDNDEKNGDNSFPSTSKDSNIRTTSPSLALSRSISCTLPEDLDLHLDSMDSELDGIKELLRGEGYSLDANTLLGLFNEDPLAYDLPMTMDTDENKISGGELMAYVPNNPALDFTDLFRSPGEDRVSSPVTPELKKDPYIDYSSISTPVVKSEMLEGSDELRRTK